MLRFALALLALSLSGCTVNQPALNQTQAIARVEQLIHDAAGAIAPPPRLELIESSVAPHACLNEDQPDGMVVIGRAYWLRDIPKSEHAAVSQQVHTHWQAQGHRITATTSSGSAEVKGMSSPDGFVLSLSSGRDGDLYLAASSPCVWPDGHPSE